MSAEFIIGFIFATLFISMIWLILALLIASTVEALTDISFIPLADKCFDFKVKLWKRVLIGTFGGPVFICCILWNEAAEHLKYKINPDEILKKFNDWMDK